MIHDDAVGIHFTGKRICFSNTFKKVLSTGFDDPYIEYECRMTCKAYSSFESHRVTYLTHSGESIRYERSIMFKLPSEEETSKDDFQTDTTEISETSNGVAISQIGILIAYWISLVIM